MMSIFLSGCMLAGKLPSTLMHVVIIPLLKCKSKDPADINNYRPIAITSALSNVLEQVLLSRLARYLWTADSQFGFKQAYCTEMATFALKQTVDSHHNQDSPVYMCFLMQKKAFDRVNHWTLEKKLLDRNVSMQIMKLFIFWYRKQEFMVRLFNSLSMTFRCSNRIRQGGQLSPLLYNVYSDDLNHHLKAKGVGCNVGGAWVNSLSYADALSVALTTVQLVCLGVQLLLDRTTDSLLGKTTARWHGLTRVACPYRPAAPVPMLHASDDMVLLAPMVTTPLTLLEECRAYAGPHDIVYNTTKTDAGPTKASTGSVLNKSHTLE